jgi:hypothetical protein
VVLTGLRLTASAHRTGGEATQACVRGSLSSRAETAAAPDAIYSLVLAWRESSIEFCPGLWVVWLRSCSQLGCVAPRRLLTQQRCRNAVARAWGSRLVTALASARRNSNTRPIESGYRTHVRNCLPLRGALYSWPCRARTRHPHRGPAVARPPGQRPVTSVRPVPCCFQFKRVSLYSANWRPGLSEHTGFTALTPSLPRRFRTVAVGSVRP